MKLEVYQNNTKCYDIICVSGDAETGVLSGQGEELSLSYYLQDLGFSDRKIAVVTDDVVAPVYADAVIRELQLITDTVRLIVLPSGEENKHLGTVDRIYEMLIREHFDRHDLIVALGGGVIGDIAGFAAATFLRGIAFVQVPTTLLAMCDSSIGGKTGVDFDAYKNMIGAFYMPRLVYMHTQVLKTLPERQLRAGLAEVVKYGLICDEAFFTRVAKAAGEASFSQLLQTDATEAVGIITESCRFKKEVVEEDPFENGRRAILNYGHTIGHAIEKLSGFKMLHGECVAIGSIAAAFISKTRGMLREEAYDRIVTSFHKMGLCLNPAAFHVTIRQADVLLAMKSDKKADKGTVKFILLNGIGNAVIATDVTKNEILDALREVGVGE